MIYITCILLYSVGDISVKLLFNCDFLSVADVFVSSCLKEDNE